MLYNPIPWLNRSKTISVSAGVLPLLALAGLTPPEYKDVKNLKQENLRDHMTSLKLIFTMLGEEGTRIEALKATYQQTGITTGKSNIFYTPVDKM